ncbi:MAG: TlpA family protein disulfide reductase [Deltaproteobacteria bacterium]|nr:MAG: TlpA family protein disulfide reductase [Deltaproteobacteria bacterium]
MRKHLSVIAVATLVLVLAFSFAFAEEAAKPKIPGVGDMVVDFTLPDLNGNEVNFNKDIKGKHEATFIIFMTSACSACQAEVAAINDIVKKYGDKVGMYCVAVDLRGADTVKPYAETYQYKATFLLDPKFTVPRKFGFSYTPSVLIVDKGGKIVFKKGGYMPGDEDLLAEKVYEMVK